MTLLRLLAGAAAACVMTVSASADEPLEILERFAEDYERDPSFVGEMTFGVQIGADFYTVEAREGDIAVRAGEPEEPSVYFAMDAETLRAIDAGEMNALTAAVKARSSDPAPLELEVMDGFEGRPDFDVLQRLLFHFWTRGQPEVILFGAHLARTTHGFDASVLYYQEGFRSGYFAVLPGQHVNADPADQANPFPSLFILFDGEVEARINGRQLTLRAGEAVLIPGGHAHEFWLDEDAPAMAQGFLFMFGEGA